MFVIWNWVRLNGALCSNTNTKFDSSSEKIYIFEECNAMTNGIQHQIYLKLFLHILFIENAGYIQYHKLKFSKENIKQTRAHVRKLNIE